MIVTLEQFRSIARGVARVEKKDGTTRLHRFTEEQEQMYQGVSPDFYKKSMATAGVILEFDTDSILMGLSVRISPASSRYFFTHSVFCDGERIGELSGEIGAGDRDVSFHGMFILGEGMKRVKVVFPWSVASRIQALTLDDGAKVIPVKKTRKMVLFGDSITHGYDALKPENSYASKLVQWLDADGINKAIGGERFCPALAALPEAFTPELITVAHGTNDWSGRTREVLEQESTAFFHNLRESYPRVPIVALAPIWRLGYEEEKPAGPFRDIVTHYRKIAAGISDMTVIDCFDFVPHDRDYFSDRRLHPNDEGFAFYAEGLIKALGEM